MTTHVRVALLLAAVLVTAPAAACGSSDQTSSADGAQPTADASARATATGAPSAPPTAASPTPSPYPIPENAAYDEVLGGLNQIVAWRVSADRRSVGLIFVAGPDGGRPGVRARIRGRLVQLMIRDALPQPAVAAAHDTSGGSPISAAQMVFPPDDALVILELRLAPGSGGGMPAVKLSWSQPDVRGFVALTVNVR